MFGLSRPVMHRNLLRKAVPPPMFSSFSTMPNTVWMQYNTASDMELKNITLKKDASKIEFNQAVIEVLEDLEPVFKKYPSKRSVFRHMVEPERVVKFKVPWVDDKGFMRVHRGYRVQYNSALGPYKGGLRFHPTVNESILKFLGFEQILKNSLTGLSMGGGKGGSNFDPKGKSEAEIAKFCQSFMTELFKIIGPHRDVPAGDIGVGGREIGYMFGQYRRLTSDFSGVLTGKGLEWGGSNIRPEATGYGCVYFANEAMGGNLSGLRCAISGSGNVAQFTAEKLVHLGAIPVSFSDSSGYIYKADGFTQEDIDAVKELKSDSNRRVSEMEKSGIEFVPNKKVWGVPCDLAFPSATQNELDADDARKLVQQGCKGVFEGANMPTTADAIDVLLKNGVTYGPGKAANAGGVAVSGLEMAQDAQMQQWSREEVDQKLQNIMKNIHRKIVEAQEEFGVDSLKAGANIAGFMRVSNAIESQGF